MEDVRLESHGGELHFVVLGHYICDFAAFARQDRTVTVGALADIAVENMKNVLKSIQPK